MKRFSWISLLPPELPVMIRQAALAELFRATAAGFGCPAPEFARLPNEQRLRAYALFTRDQAEHVLQSCGDVAAVKNRLYGNAYRLGAKLRKWMGIRTISAAVRVGQLLYRAIEIDLQGDAQGSLTVSRCYFSQFYSCQVCGLISALDDGLFSGLSGGGRLSFSKRLTEGSTCCRAKLAFPEAGAR